MTNIGKPLDYFEYCEITTTKEKELDSILRIHGIVVAIHILKALNKTLSNLYTSNDMILENVITLIDKEKFNLDKRITKLRKESESCDNTPLNQE